MHDKLKEFNEFLMLRVRGNITLDELLEHLKNEAIVYGHKEDNK